MKVLDSFIENLYTGEAVEFRRLKITPVFIREEAELPYLEFEEALNQIARITRFRLDALLAG